MRTRMSGGVGGARGIPGPYADLQAAGPDCAQSAVRLNAMARTTTRLQESVSVRKIWT